jgi:hypothetical protein
MSDPWEGPNVSHQTRYIFFGRYLFRILARLFAVTTSVFRGFPQTNSGIANLFGQLEESYEMSETFRNISVVERVSGCKPRKL